MSDLRDAAQQALEALEYIRSTTVWQADKHAANPAINALKAALEQPEQEPVAWRWRMRNPTDSPGFAQPWNVTTYYPREQANEIEPLYTAPPRREWRSLSKEEFGYIYVRSATHEEFARAIEAALRSKNHDHTTRSPATG